MRGTGRRWGLFVLAVLVVLNALVLAVLLRQSVSPGATESWTPEPTADAPPTPAPADVTEAPESTAGDSVQPTIEPAWPATRQLVAVDEEVAWRSTLASCGEGVAIVERTTDGGSTWEAIDLDLSSVVRLRATSVTDAFTVGAGVDCATTLASTSDGGDSWTRADASLSSAWYLAPTDRSMVDGPQGEAPVPCPAGAIDLAAADVQQGAVLCRDGSVAVSGDGGQSWSTTVSIAGARALAQVNGGYAVATYEGGCAALSIYNVTTEGQAQPDPFVCAPTTPSSEVAVSILGDQVWVWSGADLVISRDGGQTW